MISQKMQDALNAHVTNELYSANLYLSMSAWCEGKAYKGFRRWLRVQYFEELDPSHKLLDWIVARGGHPAIGAVGAPPAEFGSILASFLEEEPFRAGTRWALWRLAAVRPEAVAAEWQVRASMTAIFRASSWPPRAVRPRRSSGARARASGGGPPCRRETTHRPRRPRAGAGRREDARPPIGPAPPTTEAAPPGSRSQAGRSR